MAVIKSNVSKGNWTSFGGSNTGSSDSRGNIYGGIYNSDGTIAVDPNSTWFDRYNSIDAGTGDNAGSGEQGWFQDTFSKYFSDNQWKSYQDYYDTISHVGASSNAGTSAAVATMDNAFNNVMSGSDNTNTRSDSSGSDLFGGEGDADFENDGNVYNDNTTVTETEDSCGQKSGFIWDPSDESCLNIFTYCVKYPTSQFCLNNNDNDDDDPGGGNVTIDTGGGTGGNIVITGGSGNDNNPGVKTLETLCGDSGGTWTNGACICPDASTLTNGECLIDSMGSNNGSTNNDVDTANQNEANRLACIAQAGKIWDDVNKLCTDVGSAANDTDQQATCEATPGKVWNVNDQRCLDMCAPISFDTGQTHTWDVNANNGAGGCVPSDGNGTDDDDDNNNNNETEQTCADRGGNYRWNSDNNSCIDMCGSLEGEHTYDDVSKLCVPVQNNNNDDDDDDGDTCPEGQRWDQSANNGQGACVAKDNEQACTDKGPSYRYNANNFSCIDMCAGLPGGDGNYTYDDAANTCSLIVNNNNDDDDDDDDDDTTCNAGYEYDTTAQECKSICDLTTQVWDATLNNGEGGCKDKEDDDDDDDDDDRCPTNAYWDSNQDECFCDIGFDPVTIDGKLVCLPMCEIGETRHPITLQCGDGGNGGDDDDGCPPGQEEVTVNGVTSCQDECGADETRNTTTGVCETNDTSRCGNKANSHWDSNQDKCVCDTGFTDVNGVCVLNVNIDDDDDDDTGGTTTGGTTTAAAGAAMSNSSFFGDKTVDKTTQDPDWRTRGFNLWGEDTPGITDSLVDRLNTGYNRFTENRFSGANADQLNFESMLRDNVTNIPGRGLYDQARGYTNRGGGTDVTYDPVTGEMISGTSGGLQGDARSSIQDIISGQFSGSNLDNYMNPYMDSVVDASLSDIERERQMQLQSNNSAATLAGAYGGDRAALVNAETNRAAMDQKARVAAELRARGFDKAADLYTSDADRAMTGDRANQLADLTTTQDSMAIAADMAQRNQIENRLAQESNQDRTMQAGRDLMDAFRTGSDAYYGALDNYGAMGDRVDARSQREKDFAFSEHLAAQGYDQDQISNLIQLFASAPNETESTKETEMSTVSQIGEGLGLVNTGATAYNALMCAINPNGPNC